MQRSKYLTVVAFARLCGASPKTLRFYNEIDLFRPAFTDPRTRYRYYTEEQLCEFARIQALRDSGASLADIRRTQRMQSSASEQESMLCRLRDAKLRAIDAARRSLAWIEGELGSLGQASPFRATIAYCAPLSIASLRTDLHGYSDIHQHERMLLESVAPCAGLGLRGVLWHRCADRGVIEAEPFVEIRRGSPRPGRYDINELPGTHVARAFSSFDDDEAEATHVALSRWIRDRGLAFCGARREIYRGRLLEIQQPLRAG
jgi:DNA-binding transcriptional MerR regulator